MKVASTLLSLILFAAGFLIGPIADAGSLYLPDELPYVSGYQQPKAPSTHKHRKHSTKSKKSKSKSKSKKSQTEAGLCPYKDHRCFHAAPAAKSKYRLDTTKIAGLEEGRKTALPYASRLQKKMSVGLKYGHARDRHGRRRYLCWRAVWEILKSAHLVRGELTQNSAEKAYKDLRRQGFHNDMSACNTPGVVRIYNGNRKYHSLSGDRFGHIEILGTDRRFHSFMSSPDDIEANFKRRGLVNSRLGARRILKMCMVKG